MEEKTEIKSRERLYRGININELKNIDIRSFSKLVNSRERRTLLRNYEKIEKFIEKINKSLKKNSPIRTHQRSLVIVPQFIGKTIFVHNGREFVKVKITEEMLGHRLGEFAPTRKPVKHGAAGVGATKSSASRSVK